MLRKTPLLLLLLIGQILWAQKYEQLEFEVLDNTQGLISDVVKTSHQDAFGFMWFGTTEGLVRYDGYEFKTFKNHPHLGQLYGLDINYLYADNKENMYVCTDQGICIFNANYEGMFTFVEEQLKGQSVSGVLRSQDGTIYITANGSLYVVDELKQSIEKHNYKTAKNYVQVKGIVEDRLGRIFLGGWGCSILQYDRITHRFTDYNIWKSQKGFIKTSYCLHVDLNNNLWIGSWNEGVFAININSDDEVTILETYTSNTTNEIHLPDNVILSINEDKYGSIWIGTPYGLSIIKNPLQENSSVHTYSAKDGKGDLSNSTITEIKQFGDNIMWLSTNGGGVNKLHLNQNMFSHLKLPTIDEKKHSQTVYDFCTDTQGRLLVGVKSLGFFIADEERTTLTHYSESPIYGPILNDIEINSITSFQWYNDHTLILGTRYKGAIICDLKTKKKKEINKTTRFANFRGRTINDILVLDDGAVLLGTNVGLNIIKKRKNGWSCKFISLGKDNGRSTVQSIVSYQDDKVIIATKERGLFLIEKNEKGNYKAQTLTQCDKKVLCMHNDNDEQLWIGTLGNGLIRYDIESNTFESPKIEGNSLGDVIYAIKQDRNNNLWFTSNAGLKKLKYKNGEYHTESYSHLDGLQGNIFVRGAFYEDERGEFYIGGYNGYNHFDPLSIKSEDQNSRVVITEIKVEGDPVPYHYGQKNTITMQHDENNLSIMFSELSYVFSKANQYAYKIEGIDKDWHYVSSNVRSANYNSLPHGDYTFKLKGSNSKGVWSDEEVKLFLKVKQSPFKSMWAIMFYLIATFGLVTLFFRQRLLNERIQQEMELEQLRSTKADKLNQYKLSFFTNMSHELLTPLSILSSIAEEVSRSQHFTTNTLEMMTRNVNSLNRLIKQLLTFRKVETGNMKLHYTEEDVSEQLSQCASDFSILAEKKNINYSIQISQNIHGQIDREKLELVTRNLLSNAFKYTPEGGEITFILPPIDKNNTLSFSIKDTGRGIKHDEISKLFSRFYRVHDDTKSSNEGVGIGLNLSKNLVTMMQGKIAVESTLGKGSTFTVSLPLQEVEAQTEDESTPTEIEMLPQSISHTEEEQEKEVNTFKILLVEDNEDFRHLLKTRLEEKYTVIEADDGQKGFDLAKKHDIDLILSDVMMPKMSGLELCRSIKGSSETNHIPVILLTAKVGDENRKEGYAAGADSFLEKPVDMNLLQVRIRSIIKQRQVNRKNANLQISTEVKQSNITPYDEKFFSEIQKLIEDNMSNVDFSVKELSQELNVSNSMLYRKVKNLIGISPSHYIRETRLKRASKMLENKSFSISEVAYNCGFNELSYFGLCFKKQYGVTPTAYQDGERIIDQTLIK